MARSKRRNKRIKVTLDVPLNYKLPRRVYAVNPVLHPPKRSRSVQIVQPSRTRRQTVTVVLPKRARVPSAAYAQIRRGRTTIFSQRRTRRELRNSFNRKRFVERKNRRNGFRVGQITSVSNDRYGLIGNAVSRGRSPIAIANAAMVTRAITRR